MPVKQRKKQKNGTTQNPKNTGTTSSSNKNNQQKSLKMDTHVFFCCGTRTNSQEKPSICTGENGLALSTLDSLQSFFILSVIFLKNLTASPQVSSRSESRHSKRRNLKFRTIKHQCPDSSLGFMVATNDGGSKVGKRRRKEIAKEN